jgi:luciferase-like monooxygenase
MHIGVDSFVSTVTDPKTERVVGPEERIEHLLEEIALADSAGLYSFGIGEHHREEYYDSAPPVILGAAAARTSRIRLGSAVTVLSAADPVRVFQQFAPSISSPKVGSTWSSGAARSPRHFRCSAWISPTTTRCSPRSSTCC